MSAVFPAKSTPTNDEVQNDSIESGGLPYIVIQIRDVTRRKEMEEELAEAAKYDTLTGLSTRAAFHKELQHCFSSASRKAFAVLFLDLDRFKQVNDTLGHEAGDQILVGVAGRICQSLRGNRGVKKAPRSSDVAARLGGDEFVILLDDIDSAEAATAVARRLRAAVAKPFRIQGRPVDVGVSVGVATSFAGFQTAESMLRSADLAMYDAKRADQAGGVVTVSDLQGPITRTDSPLRLAA